MKPCLVVENCDVATVHRIGDVLLSVGIQRHEGEKFLAVCAQDVAGCQHIMTKCRAAFSIIEGVAHALFLLSENE
jgi:hypothetical protein